jgi:hypothetical protein
MSEKKCNCAAHNSDECQCGAWDDLDPYRLKSQLEAMIAEVGKWRKRAEGLCKLIHSYDYSEITLGEKAKQIMEGE